MKTKKFTSLRRQLMLLLLTGLLPLFIFSVCVVGYVAFQRQKALETSMISNVRALSGAVEGQLDTIQSSLELLIAVEDFNHANMKDLHRRLKRFVDGQRDWSSIGISGVDGKQIFSTIKPFGYPLPSWSDQDFFQEILKTGKPVLSGYRVGRVSGLKNFSLAVPVKKNSHIEYVLVATVNTKFLAEILNRQKIPAAWTSTILDHEGIIMARNIFHDRFSGEKASDYVLKKIANSEQFFETVNKEDKSQYGTSTDLPNGWKLYLGIPLKQSKLPSMNIFWLMLVGGSTLLTIGLALSIRLSQKIAEPITSLSYAAKLIGKGEKADMVESDVSEIHEVAVALHNASGERDLADEKARQAIELRDNFLSVASHELKTPLTTINLQSHRLFNLANDPSKFTTEKLAKSSSAILNQTKRLTRLVDDLLDISRITAGKLDINKEKLELGSIIKEIVSHFEGINNPSQISLNILSPVEGHFDRNRMEQIVTNLISNAIKYGDKKPIEISLSTMEGKANIQVKDNGIGIEEKDHHKIFERFERLVSNREISGLGLGLWIVHRIVTQLEGEIRVASEGAGKGSIFSVTIPLE